MADLLTVSELASYLQRDLDTSSATLAKNNAQGIVRRYCRQTITTATHTATLPIVVRRGSYGVMLPQRPVTAITSVSVNGTAYVDGTDYAWSGSGGWVALARVVEPATAFTDSDPVATVVYTAGYATVPDEVKAVALAVAARQYDNPTGVRSWSIDDGSETKAGADDDLAGVSLLKAERDILDDYRRRAGSVIVR